MTLTRQLALALAAIPMLVAWAVYRFGLGGLPL